MCVVSGAGEFGAILETVRLEVAHKFGFIRPSAERAAADHMHKPVYYSGKIGNQLPLIDIRRACISTGHHADLENACAPNVFQQLE